MSVDICIVSNQSSYYWTHTHRERDMALAQFHFFITGLCLTIWTHNPALVLAFAWALQSLMYICGINPGDFNDYIWWTFLSTLGGVAIGVGVFMVTKLPHLLRLQASYADSWIKFTAWFIVFILLQLFYGFFPIPESPGGLIGTILGHLILMCGVWWWYSTDNPQQSMAFRDYLGRNYLFLVWTIVLFACECMFFLTYLDSANGSDKYSALAATGLGAAILLAFAALYPLNPAYAMPQAPLMSAPPMEEK